MGKKFISEFLPNLTTEGLASVKTDLEIITDEERAKLTAATAPIELLNASERKLLTSYDPDGVVVGVTRVTQTDTEGILWSLVAADVTLDASWIAQPYSTDPDGTIVINMELANFAGIVPDANVFGQVAGVPSIGDGVATGGNKVAMSSDLLSLTLVGDATNNVKAYALDEWAVDNEIDASWKDVIGTTNTTLHIGQGITAIGSSAFYYCPGFTGSLTIPDSVTTIGSSAFYYCDGFTGSLTIPDSVTSIGSGAFQFCNGFTGSLTIPDSITTIGDDTFFGGDGFTGSLTIPDSVTSIGDQAFKYCFRFTGSLTIPDSVTSIGDYAFASCDAFTGSLTIGDSVTSIGSAAFSECSGFTGSLTIPDSVTTIGSSAFSSCTNITNVDCHVTRTIMNATNCLLSSGVTTLHAETGKGWTAGADTIGGKALTVIIDL